MNTDKLLKAIQILIKEELKQQLPALIKEGVTREIKRVLAEGNTKAQPKKESEGFSMAKAILGEDSISQPKQKVENVTYTKNPILNDILNETRMSTMQNDGGYRTMEFNSSDMGSVMARTAIAEKMGYGDLTGGVSIPMTTLTGAPVNPNNEGVQTVAKAMNRDYSELVKRFNKK
jgi:hypothetical protein